MKIGVLDYGSGNLHSVIKALQLAGAEVSCSNKATELAKTEGLVVPGVGAFAACMAGLQAVSGDELIRNWIASGKKLLGICVGHQILFSRGLEHGTDSAGIGIFQGTVEQLRCQRLPHMGWNLVDFPDLPVFNGSSGRRFYFVHSYGVRQFSDDRVATAWSEHDSERFLAALSYQNVLSTQFHPEKSGEAGAVLLRSWLMS